MKTKTFVIFIGVLLSVTVFGFVAIFIMNLTWFGGMTNRRIEDIQAFDELWNMSINLQTIDVVNENEFTPNVFVSVHDEAVVYQAKELIGVDKNTGEIIWQKDMRSPHQISSDASRIYLISRNDTSRTTPKRCDPDLPICESIYVTALEANSGKSLWTNTYANMFHVDKFFSDGDTATLLGSGSHGAYTSRISIFTESGAEMLFQQDTPISSSSSQWNISYTRFMEKKLGYEPFEIIAAISTDDNSFFLTKSDSSLWAIENNSNEVVGRVEFSGTPFVFGDINRFALGAEDNVVVVYLGDSNQMFAFQMD